MKRLALVMMGLMLALAGTQTASAAVIVYAGYLNNLSGPPAPADIPTPFDADATTTLISSGGSTDPHDTGVLRFENTGAAAVTINPGISVTTQGATFAIWDSFLPFTLLPGDNLVLAETANFNFDSSDFGLGIDPIVAGSIDGVPFSFTDTSRILLGHEDATNTAETTPYGVLGTVGVAAVPEPSSVIVFGLSVVGTLFTLRRRRTS